MNPAFWQDKQVLITGHTGFKGGWLSLWLRYLGSQVIGYALDPPTEPSFFEATGIAQDMTSIIGDIREYDHVKDAVAKHRPKIVFHMAAQPLVLYSYENPIETYETNVLGTLHLLEAIRHVGGVKVVVIVTSDKCYENREWVWGYREGDPMGGYDPYSSSKGCAELLTAAFRASYFHPRRHGTRRTALASARAGNVIGGGDWAENRLIPDIIRCFIEGKPAEIRNPHAIRPWQHVLEPLGGYLLLAEKMWHDGTDFAEGWNFGPKDDDSKTVQWIAENMTRLWGEQVAWNAVPVEQLHEARYLKLDCSKAKARLDWQPVWNLSRALEATVEWYKAYQAEGDMHQVTVTQIQQYIQDIESAGTIGKVFQEHG